jgi:hypothetical protein
MKHDDKVGEDIPEEEALMYRKEVVQQVLICRALPQALCMSCCKLDLQHSIRHIPQPLTHLYACRHNCKHPVAHFQSMCMQLRRAFLALPAPQGDQDDGLSAQDYSKLQRSVGRLEFPGSQPVSLSASNQDLIYSHRCDACTGCYHALRCTVPLIQGGGPPECLCVRRYWFSWKADGTRYMMYISNSGTYLVDRRMCITRVQMRFPLWLRRNVSTDDMQGWMRAFQAGRLPHDKSLKPGKVRLHHATLLDGEMVIDAMPDGSQRRVFYMYDLMMLNGVNTIGLPWKVCGCGRVLTDCLHACAPRCATRMRDVMLLLFSVAQ